MKQILSDFHRLHVPPVIGYILVDIFTVSGMALAGLYSNEKMWWQALLVTAFLCMVTVIYVVDVLIIAPQRFKKYISQMAQKDVKKLYSQYAAAKFDNGHRYMKQFLLFYYRRRIYVVKYSDITEIEGGTRNLFITANGYKKPLVLAFDSAGPNAVAMAFIRNKNPDVRVVCNNSVKDAD